MNTQETASVLSLLKMNYPQHFNKLNNEDKDLLLKFWSRELEKYNYDTVINATATVIKSEEYCPPISKVLEQIRIDTKGMRAGATLNIKYINCKICKDTGTIPYKKNVNLEGSVGVKELNFSCKCSCNTSNSGIPTYYEIFGFNPMPYQKQPGIEEEKVNVPDIIKSMKRMIACMPTL